MLACTNKTWSSGVGVKYIDYIINQKIDTFQQDVNQKFDSLQKDFNQKFDKIDERLTKLEVGQAKLTEKVDGMDRRLEKVEGTQKNHFQKK